MPSPTEPQPILYRRSTILFLIFVAAGVFTIPLIWRSPAFGRGEKIFWSVVAAAYTGLAVGLLVVYVIYIFVSLSQLNIAY